MAMENITNILYSLLPLVVIIFLSWLFSQMGAKAKKRAESGQKEPPSLPGDHIMDILLGKGGTDDAQARAPENLPGRSSGTSIETWNVNKPVSGPEPTPKAIRPKWWGA